MMTFTAPSARNICMYISYFERSLRAAFRNLLALELSEGSKPRCIRRISIADTDTLLSPVDSQASAAAAIRQRFE
jgi:hypothetical protein